eukprot:TRINITY_DN17545_c0_g1_i1.p1 TRINITY_DN17545_c0_g1~~TRINITY_DN17545_c0_g1_i1.p1  ORF type:complete len:69 (+),score=10.66 TRINITY_DN17545_c0_g1_i1:33-239(+)
MSYFCEIWQFPRKIPISYFTKRTRIHHTCPQIPPHFEIPVICKDIFGVFKIWPGTKLQNLSVFEDFHI